MSEFDEKAATWDDDPVRVKRAEDIAARMRELLDLKSFTNAMEYGSGTGLLSFSLKDDLKKVTLMDASEGMTEVAREKVKTHNIKNLYPVQGDLAGNDYKPNEKFDLVFILLTLHHVDDTDDILSRFRQIMQPKGVLAIIDLEKEDGSFHDGEFHGHLGFDREELEPKLVNAGFNPYHYEVCYEIEKGEGEEKRKYPVFMLLASLQ